MRACGFSTWNLGEVQVLGKEPCSGLRHCQWGMSQWTCRPCRGLNPRDCRDLRREGRVEHRGSEVVLQGMGDQKDRRRALGQGTLRVIRGAEIRGRGCWPGEGSLCAGLSREGTSDQKEGLAGMVAPLRVPLPMFLVQQMFFIFPCDLTFILKMLEMRRRAERATQSSSAHPCRGLTLLSHRTCLPSL